MRIGQKLVCIVAFDAWPDSRPLPVKGEIYTFDGFEANDDNFIHLLGFDFICGNGKRIAYAIDYFRPIDETFAQWVEDTLMKEVEYEETVKELEIQNK